jgi:hypothetical protein
MNAMSVADVFVPAVFWAFVLPGLLGVASRVLSVTFLMIFIWLPYTNIYVEICLFEIPIFHHSC